MIDATILDEIYAFLEDEFKDNQERLKHIKNVEKVSLSLASIYGLDETKVRIASLLHDATKNRSNKENSLIASSIYSREELKNAPLPCMHAYSAAVLAKEKFLIEDEDILNSIIYHCSGRKNMSMLEKVIYVSDFIEESRDFVSEDLRGKAFKSLDLTVYEIMIITKKYLERNKKVISPMTLEAIEYYKNLVLEELND
jgi:nicotinate-nucleotide adenylyltransferase